MEVHPVRSTASLLNEQEEPQGQPPSEPLEVTIAKRAHEISQRGGGRHDHSLASWLEAAREVLSEDVESPD